MTIQVRVDGLDEIKTNRDAMKQEDLHRSSDGADPASRTERGMVNWPQALLLVVTFF